MENVAVTNPEAERSAKSITTLIYVLYAASFLAGGITAIVAIVMNYIKKEDVAGTFLESHFRWQIRTFWFGLLWTAVGAALMVVLIGWAVLAVNTVWLIYRIAKGLLRLSDNKPMYV